MAQSQAALVRHVVEGTDPAGRELALSFTALELQLSSLAQQALAPGALDTARKRREIRVSAMRLIGNLRINFGEYVRQVLEEAYAAGMRLVGARPKGFVQRQAIGSIVEASIARLDSSLATVGRQFDDVFRRVGLAQAARQLERELPAEAAADVLRRELMHRGVTGFVDSAGRHWRLSAYSRMVIRTTTAEAANRGVADAVQAVGRDLVRVSPHHSVDHPHDPENPCVALAGKTVSLTGRTQGFPVLPGLPPWHPNCEHNIAPAPELAD